MPSRGAASDVVPKCVSPTDLAAQWTGVTRVRHSLQLSHRRAVQCHRWRGSFPIRQAEVGAARTMIERPEERFGLKPERLVADTALGGTNALPWWRPYRVRQQPRRTLHPSDHPQPEKMRPSQAPTAAPSTTPSSLRWSKPASPTTLSFGRH